MQPGGIIPTDLRIFNGRESMIRKKQQNISFKKAYNILCDYINMS